MEIKLDGKYASDIYGTSSQVLTVTRNSPDYPVLVEFTSGNIRMYSRNGLGAACGDQLTEIPEFKKDDMVMVRDSCKDQWERRRFSHTEEGQYLCLSDSCSEWSSSGRMTTWKYCRKPTPDELGE